MNHSISPVTTGLILITDDDNSMRMLLRLALEQESYQVEEANNGEECLRLYEELQPDLILLDAVMPVMDGFTCCSKLQSLIAKDGSHTAILMITVLDDPESVEQAFSVGATDYITKPINWSVLRQRVKRIINQSIQNKQMYSLVQQLESTNQKLEQLQTLSSVDNVTKLPNSRKFEEYLRQQWLITTEKQSPLAIMLIDIDNFSEYNYLYGYQAGEKCLEQIAGVINKVITRPIDLITRYREAVFGVILPEIDIKLAGVWGESIRQLVKDLKIIHYPYSSSSIQYLTVTCSIASTRPQINTNPESLLIKVYQGIVNAKQSGGDRLITVEM